MKNKTILVVLGLLAVATTIGTFLLSRTGSQIQQPTDRDSISIRFPIPIIEAGQTPFYSAADEGFYENERLDVSFEMGSKELNPIKMVASGLDDFGIIGGPDTLLVARAAGQELTTIAIVHRNSNFPCLVTLTSSGITALEQLQGKKVGFFYGHISTDVLRTLLREQGIEVTEVDVGFNYSQLIAGRIDAQWAFTVTAGLDLPARGIDIHVLSPADYGIVTHGYTIFTRQSVIDENPELVLRFLRATLQGIVYASENPDLAVETLLRRNPALDRDLSVERLKAYNAVTSNSAEFPPGYMDADMFRNTYDRLLDEGILAEPFEINTAFTTKFLEQIRGKP